MEHRPGILTLIPPRAEPSPLVVEAPRSGREYPNAFRIAASFETLHAYVSMYVEEIYAHAPDSGATLLWANFPNSFVDANRHIEDIDPDLLAEPWPGPINPGDKSTRLGTGLFHKWGKDDLPLYDRKLTVAEVQHRIEAYYKPYHRRLAELIEDNVRRFGASWHLSCHCMASIGPRFSHDRGQPRSDICLSDRHGTTADPAFLQASIEAFKAEGFSVTVNDPFVGQESVRMHSDPPNRRNSLQIEMIKGLYMNEETFNKNERFADTQRRIGLVVARIGAWCRRSV